MGNNGWRVLVASCGVRQLGVAVVAAPRSSIWSVADPAAVGEPSAHERHVQLRLRPEHAAGWWNSRQFTWTPRPHYSGRAICEPATRSTHPLSPRAPVPRVWSTIRPLTEPRGVNERRAGPYPYFLKASLTFSPASLRSALPCACSPFDCRLLLPVARPPSSLTLPVSHWSLLLAL